MEQLDEAIGIDVATQQKTITFLGRTLDLRSMLAIMMKLLRFVRGGQYTGR